MHFSQMVHAQGCLPKLGRASSSQARITLLEGTHSCLPSHPQNNSFASTARRTHEANSATGRWAEFVAESFGRYYSLVSLLL